MITAINYVDDGQVISNLYLGYLIPKKSACDCVYQMQIKLSKAQVLHSIKLIDVINEKDK